MSRWRTLGVRLLVAALLAVALLWGCWWTCIWYEVHRARQMFDEAARIHVGDSEASVLPVVRRYDGFKWTPEPLSPREDSLDKDAYDYEKSRMADYNYELDVSPFVSSEPQGSRWTRVMQAIRGATPARLRPVLGMRDWRAWAKVAIRSGRVQSVSAETIFLGSSEWLGDSWELADGMPRYGMPQRTYVVGVAHLTMGDPGGTMIQNFLEPKASKEEAAAARQFNLACWTSIKGCSGLCDVAPRAIEYLKRHPDAAWGIIQPECP